MFSGSWFHCVPGLPRSWRILDSFPSRRPTGCLDKGSSLPSRLLRNISSELQEPCLPLPFVCQQLFLVSGMAGLDLFWFLSPQPDRFLFSFLLSSFASGSAKVSKPSLPGMQLDCVVSFLSPSRLHTFSDSSLPLGVCWYLSPKLPDFKRQSYL